MKGAITIKGLRKSFAGLEIIRGIDLEVRPGERHAVIGPNGAGKSTLFNLISGLHAPSGGDIRLDGVPIHGVRPHVINRLGLARSFQITNIFPRLTIFENARIGVLGRHGYRFNLLRRAAHLRRVNEEADALLEMVWLSHMRDKIAGDLAYSDQRALEIAMTLSTGAKVILLDEPTAGMSTKETSNAVDLIRRVTQGMTLLIVEHDMNVVFTLCDRISVLVYGQLLATGRPDEIRRNVAVQTAYLGEVQAGEAS